MTRVPGKFLFEGVLIVISILIAFAIDAWWEERQDRDEERRVLSALRAEFAENVQLLPAHIEVAASAVRHSKEAVDQIQAVGEGGSITVTPEQLMSFISFGSFDAVRGAFDAMLQSGELRYIRNHDLRRKLVRWPMLVADAVENAYFLRIDAGPRTFEYLSVRVDLGLSDIIVVCKRENSPESCPSASFELEATRELSSLLMMVNGWSRESAHELELVRQETLELMRMLDEELAGL